MSDGPQVSLQSWESSITVIRPKLEKVLPAWLTTDRFVQQAMIALGKNKTIMECDRNSVFYSLLGLAELGLDPSGALGSGYLVPFKGMCTPVPGYRGLIDLAVRSGEVKGIKAVNVFWGDEFDLEEGDRPRLHHKPKLPTTREEEKDFESHRHQDNLRGAYMIATLPGGNRQFHYMPFSELEKIRMRAPGGKSEKTPWFTDRLSMYLKCPIRSGVKQLPLSPVKASLLVRGGEHEGTPMLARVEQLEEENEELVKRMSAVAEPGEPPPKKKGAEVLKDAMRRGRAEPEDAEFTTDTQEPPPDVELPTAGKPKDS